MQFSYIKKHIALSILFFFGWVSGAAAGTMLVVNEGANSVSLFNETTWTPIKEIAVGYKPHEVAVSPNGKLALVSNFGTLINIVPGNTLTLVDVVNAKVLRTITLEKCSRPHGIRFLSDTQALVTAQGIQSLLVVDVVAGVVTKTIPLPGQGAHIVTVDAQGKYAYVANTDSGTVCKVDLSTFSVLGEVKIGKEAQGLALTQNDQVLLATNRKDNLVAIIDTNNLTVINTIATDQGPIRVAVFDQGKFAVVANSTGGTVQVIDLATQLVIKTFKATLTTSKKYGKIIGKLLPVPNSIVVRPGQKTAYIANLFAGNITLVDLEKGEIVETLESSFEPNGLAMSSFAI